MTEAELLSAAKIRIRKTLTDTLDTDISQLINTGIADLNRIGVDKTWTAAPTDPLIIETVLCYVKANYGTPDNYELLQKVYDTHVTMIKGASKYFSAAESEATGA